MTLAQKMMEATLSMVLEKKAPLHPHSVISGFKKEVV